MSEVGARWADDIEKPLGASGRVWQETGGVGVTRYPYAQQWAYGLGKEIDRSLRNSHALCSLLPANQ